jgi:hypothetical protein
LASSSTLDATPVSWKLVWCISQDALSSAARRSKSVVIINA